MEEYSIRVSGLSPNVCGSFETVIQAGDGMCLIRHRKIQEFNLALEKRWGNYSLEVKQERQEVEACVTITRTSANRYFVTGIERGKFLTFKGCNLKEVSEFISDNFCPRLDGERKNG